MKYIFGLLVILIMLLTSCSFLQNVFGPEPGTAPKVVSVSALGFEHDSLEAARLGISLLQVDSLYALPVYPNNSGKIKIKNSFNTDNSQKKSNNDESVTKDKSVVKDKAKTKAKDAGVIGNGNEVKQSKGIPPLLIYIGLAVCFLLLVAGIVAYVKFKAGKKIV